MPFKNVTVFYGHIHYKHHQKTSHIEHHAAKSLMFPLAPVGSVEKKTQVPWNAAKPYDGLGWRRIHAETSGDAHVLMEQVLTKA